MFNKIILPSTFKNKDFNTINNELNSFSNSFSFDKDSFKNIFNQELTKNEEYSILYLIYQIFKNDDYVRPLKNEKYGGIPSQGQFEFINPNNGLGLDIYHAHIYDDTKGVLIWYNIFDDYGLRLKFEYHRPHPTDNYKDILKRIINNENSYSVFPFIPLSEKHSYLKESVITSFERFCKMWKIIFK